jgi:hypothetical protein
MWGVAKCTIKVLFCYLRQIDDGRDHVKGFDMLLPAMCIVRTSTGTDLLGSASQLRANSAHMSVLNENITARADSVRPPSPESP